MTATGARRVLLVGLSTPARPVETVVGVDVARDGLHRRELGSADPEAADSIPGVYDADPTDDAWKVYGPFDKIVFEIETMPSQASHLIGGFEIRTELDLPRD